MKQLSIMIKPASSACDLRCKYCFYADISRLRQVGSFGRMTGQVMERMLENLRAELEPGDRVVFAFQGGEPALAGLDFFKAFVSAVGEWDRGISVEYALQTNALHLDDEWCEFLKKNRFLTGVSFDLLPDCHDDVRVDAEGKGTYARVLNALKLLEKHGAEYNVLCTLTNRAARHPKLIWDKILALDLKHVQFTPCLDEPDRPGESVYALTPRRFASFYDRLFGCWLADYRAGKYRSIKFFDDVVNLMAYGMPSACGMDGRCSVQAVVEADGSVYPCDFYCFDRFRMGNISEEKLSRLRETPQQMDFLTKKEPLPALCGSCPYKRFCGGGCKRMRRQVYCSDDGTYCGYRDFLDRRGNALSAIAMRERRMTDLRGR